MLPEQEWGTAHLPPLTPLQEENTEPPGWALCSLVAWAASTVWALSLSLTQA